MVSVNSTLDRGMLYISTAFIDTPAYYQGHIESYNNFLTRFFFKSILNLAMDVEIDGKIRCLDKKSYIAFLNEHGAKATLQNLSDYRRLDFINLRPSIDKGLMRHHLTASKVDKLSCKLIDAISKRNLQRIQKYLSKGADVNRPFYVRYVKSDGHDRATDNYEIIYHGDPRKGLSSEASATVSVLSLNAHLFVVANDLGETFVDIIRSYETNQM